MNRSIADFGTTELIADSGGVVLTRTSDGSIVGGIGVSGRSSEEDEAVAIAARCVVALVPSEAIGLAVLYLFGSPGRAPAGQGAYFLSLAVDVLAPWLASRAVRALVRDTKGGSNCTQPSTDMEATQPGLADVELIRSVLDRYPDEIGMTKQSRSARYSSTSATSRKTGASRALF